MLTDLQKRKLERMFRVYDTNQNGVLEKADFDRVVDGLAQTRGYFPFSELYNQLKEKYNSLWVSLELFQKSAANNPSVGSGKTTISLEQWLNAYGSVTFTNDGKGGMINRISLIAEILDSKKDGKIRLEDYQLFFKAYRLSIEEAASVFKKLDTDNDGIITVDEFIEYGTQFISGNDPNAPGNWIFGDF